MFREMKVAHYIWLLLCYAQYARSSLADDYENILNRYMEPKREEAPSTLPIELGVDKKSGCICRASEEYREIACFGSYECKSFPEVNVPSEKLRLRTSVLVEIRKGDLDSLHYLKVLKIEANHQLTYLEPGLFRNLSKLEQLSLSYNIKLQKIEEKTFMGLISLRNLTLVNNGFNNILQLTPAFQPSVLPALKGLDLSENNFEVIPKDAFLSMDGSSLEMLKIYVCRLDYIHEESFLPLKMLKELYIGKNELNSNVIGNFLLKMLDAKIELTYLDLSLLGFRKQPPKDLLDIIAQTTIKSLILTHNQFEIISDDAFPAMVNIELLDLRHVLAISVGSNAFDPYKFPNLKVLLLGGNNLPGIHNRHLSDQLRFLDLSWNKGNSPNPTYYEIVRDTFIQSKELRVLNLSFNKIKSIFDYTFRGLERLKILNLKNATLYHIGAGTFQPMKRLEVLNLANNPLNANENFTSAQFEGLNELKMLNMNNCGIKHFYDEDNIFEMMPNLTHLILRNNQLYYITAETLKPLKSLQVLDLSENLLISWWNPMFLASGVKPQRLYLTNNKISHFTLSMIQDINYLLESSRNTSAEIDFTENVFFCDCSAMYDTYLWLEVNGTMILKEYFAHSTFGCRSPDLWENRRVADYLSSIKSLQCLMYKKFSNIMMVFWTVPSLVTLFLISVTFIISYKYRIYIRYWIFLTKVSLGRKISGTSANRNNVEYKYDAFVSYCNEDSYFVSKMISHLENEAPYLKLCVYERDFEIGSYISESIYTCISESRFVVLVISNSFAKSQWCRWETHLAEYHRLFSEDGSPYDPLVLIRLSHVENKYLTATLKFLLRTKIYLPWDENASDMFWEKLRTVLAKRNNVMTM